MLIAIPLFDGFTALDAVGPYEVLWRVPGAEVAFVATEPGLKVPEIGVPAIEAPIATADVPRPDVIVVPGGFGTRAMLDGDPLVDWIRDAHPHTRWTTSVCTGSLLLAAAGLLQGLEATTHWSAADLLVRFGARPTTRRVVRQGRIITSAGVSSGIDMALLLAAELAGERVAQAIQLGIEYDPQPPFDTGSVAKAGAELVTLAAELTTSRRALPGAGGVRG